MGVKFQVIVQKKSVELNSSLERLSSQGWRPIGGIAVAMCYDVADDAVVTTFAQTMMKEDDDDDIPS